MMILERSQSLLVDGVHFVKSFIIAALLGELSSKVSWLIFRWNLILYQVGASANSMENVLRGGLTRITFQEEVVT